MAEEKKPSLITIDQALKIPHKRAREQHRKYINPGLVTYLGLVNFDRGFIRAEGVSIWDEDGNKYLDFWGGYGSLNLGHNHPKVLEALDKVKDKPGAILQKSGFSPIAGALAENLATIAPGDLEVTFFCNSGAEAVEGALRVARAASGKHRILYAQNSFHGKTFGALSVTGKEKYQKPFRPLVPECEPILFGHLHPLEQKLKVGDVAAFIVEPIQGEGGIVVPPDGYLKEAERLCRHYGAYLIVDEVQTGFGRTGKMFACEHEGVEPDIMSLAKSLGGGVMPVGAFMTTQKIWQKAYGGVNKCLSHTSTMGSSAQACAAGLATINALYEEDLIDGSLKKGDYLLQKLHRLKEKHRMIKDVRGRGLMTGIEFYEPAPGWLDRLSGGAINKLSKQYFVSMLAGILLNKYRILTAPALNDQNVLRLEPPLTVTYDEIDQAVAALDSLCSQYKGLVRTALGTAKPAARQLGKELSKTLPAR